MFVIFSPRQDARDGWMNHLKLSHKEHLRTYVLQLVTFHVINYWTHFDFGVSLIHVYLEFVTWCYHFLLSNWLNFFFFFLTLLSNKYFHERLFFFGKTFLIGQFSIFFYCILYYNTVRLYVGLVILGRRHSVRQLFSRIGKIVLQEKIYFIGNFQSLLPSLHDLASFFVFYRPLDYKPEIWIFWTTKPQLTSARSKLTTRTRKLDK